MNTCDKCNSNEQDHPRSEHYLPKNHVYGTHPTYTGPDCAQCGKEENGHRPNKRRGE